MNRRFFVLIGLLPALWLPGCVKSVPPPATPPTFPVTGVVKIDGKPTSGVKVMLYPNEETKIYDPLVGSGKQGITDAEGKFSITSFYAGDGAPVGEYKVLFYWAGNNTAAQFFDPDAPVAADPAAARFNKKYGDPRKPFKTIKVEEGKPTDLGTLDLKTK